MPITDETLGAYLDGELDPATQARVREALQQEPALQVRLQRLEELNAAIQRAFPETPANDALTARILASPLSQRSGINRGWLPQGRWAAASGALAAGLCGIVVGMSVSHNPLDRPLAEDQLIAPTARLHAALEKQISGPQNATTGIRIAMTFRSGTGRVCREFATARGDGIACKTGDTWTLVAFDSSAPNTSSTDQYITAGASTLIDDAMDSMGASDPFDAQQEMTLMKKKWHD